MRVVEVGSGSGGTSAGVLAALADLGARLDFLYTDLSPQLVAFGRKLYGAKYGCARFKTLDIEADIASQAWAPPSPTAGLADYFPLKIRRCLLTCCTPQHTAGQSFATHAKIGPESL